MTDKTADRPGRSRVHIGHYISGAGHVGLISWLLIGPLFNSEPLPFEAVSVSVVSSEEYAALVAAEEAPEVSDTVTQAPAQPDVAEDTPPPVPQEETPAPAPAETAPPVPAPAPETAPEPVEEAPPVVAEPEDVAPPAPAPPAQDQVAVVLPDTSPRPRPRPAPRVAPEPVAPPEPDARIEDQVQPEIVPDESQEATEPQEPQEATSPEEATTEIVTEADDPPSGAPERSMRPRVRPRVASAPTPAEPDSDSTADAAATTESTASAVEDALAEALGGATDQNAAPSGPPLTSGEKNDLRLAVEACWIVDVGSPSAQVTVVVAMDMDRSGQVVPGSLRMVSSSGGDATATRVAFQSARRAILRCQKDGYKLPIEKYDQWQEIEMTFNPERMRIR